METLERTNRKLAAHVFHQCFQVMFNIIHHYVDSIHVVAHNYFLQTKIKTVKTLSKELPTTMLRSTHQWQTIAMSISNLILLTLTVTIFGCWPFSNVLISRSDVIGNPSFSFSIFNLFNATISSEVKIISVTVTALPP